MRIFTAWNVVRAIGFLLILAVGSVTWNFVRNADAGVGPYIASIVRVIDGTTGTMPAYSFRSEPTLGFSRRAQSVITFGDTASEVFTMRGGLASPSPRSIAFRNDALLVWSSDGNPNLGANADLVLSRGAAGNMSIANASSANGTVSFAAFTFANIATVLTTNGQIGYCSDCTIAATCAGVGTGAIAKRLNGINVCN